MTRFNDIRTPLRHLATRRSGKARDMVAPGPDAAQLADIVALAARTPDHGKLAPWRFIHVPPGARGALSALLRAAYGAEFPNAAGQDLSPLDQFARQAPQLIILLFKPVIGAKIPAHEQYLSAGAAAMNLLHAAHAHGFVANWLTGWAAENRDVVAAFGGGADDKIIGYFFIGSPGKPLEERPRPQFSDIFQTWDAPGL